MTNSHLTIQQFTHHPHTHDVEITQYQSKLSYPIRYRPLNPFGIPDPRPEDKVEFQDIRTISGPDSPRPLSQSSSDVSFVTTLECPTSSNDRDIPNTVHGRIYSTARYYPLEKRLERYTVTAIPSNGTHPMLMLMRKSQSQASADVAQQVHQLDNQLTHLLRSDTAWFSEMLKSPPNTLDTYQDTEKALFDRISLANPDPEDQVKLVQLDPRTWQEMTGLILLDEDLGSPGDPSSSSSGSASVCGEGVISAGGDEDQVTKLSGLLASSPSTISSMGTRKDRCSKRRVRRLGKRLRCVWDTKLSCCTRPDLGWEEGDYGMVPRHSDLLFD
ncbi:hypothetical protein I302_106204 [Kwoniella bestiolae CBS 10118]|uniref:Uncharacterized protein n=1 Tax=Kwoniella bestiolae CBS 10118 TaxID=1296100 RepID=A0A1B9G3E3_9TREE|nr:hypothetical protein I302_05328 [Kwoniella bestiolae CBS 10118]OCF25508.1 hypothetical protein I302_05328 [Kwoniella bestiolae CBS 10118]